MFFSYTMSVILLSLSMYGFWCFLHDAWKWWLEPRLVPVPSCSFLVVVRNLDEDVEDLFRYLLWKIENSDIDCDVVVLDMSSNDFTTAILERLANESDILSVVVVPAGQRVLGEAVPLCRGKVVHMLDLSHRMSTDEFMVTVCALLGDRHEVLVRRVAK
ncbi:hypothetical protein [Pelosinus sp. sgz500959]|uniref:hypothetical protein n=1 Tax=Pelosinus sp. sgz500959 TaxID=3242472 RepID=UPI00366D1F18